MWSYKQNFGLTKWYILWNDRIEFEIIGLEHKAAQIVESLNMSRAGNDLKYASYNLWREQNGRSN